MEDEETEMEGERDDEEPFDAVPVKETKIRPIQRNSYSDHVNITAILLLTGRNQHHFEHVGSK